MMKLVFIGSGSAFTVNSKNYNSNMLFIDDDSKDTLLIDCGSDARHALAELGYSFRDIKNVYLSHLHADHSGGMEWLALTTKFDPHCKKPNLYANHSVIEQLWKNSLSGGLSTIQGIKTSLETFFNVHRIPTDGSFEWQNVQFQTVQTVHVISHFSFMPSFGLIFTINGTRVFITTDTQFAPQQLQDFYKNVDIIFQDCETNTVPSGVHANFRELMTLSPAIKAKMWLYHYNEGTLPDAKAEGFLGFVQKGQCFEF